MIASNFEGVDLTAPVVAVAVMAAMIVGGIGRALWNAGRRRGSGAVTMWQRVQSAGLRHVGEVGMAAAAMILGIGTWVGIQQKSIEQVNREEAVEACTKGYPRFVEWEQTGNSLENWWTGDPIPIDSAAKRATKREFIDRCVQMGD